MKVFFIFFLFAIPCISFCQLEHSVSLGPDLSIPSKENLGTATPVSIGGSVQYQLKFSTHIAAQLHVGLSRFKGVLGSKVSFIPLRLGLVGYIYRDKIFLNADAGISLYRSPNALPNQSGFGFGAGGGYRQTLQNNQFIQLSGYYNLHKYKGSPYGSPIEYDFNWVNIRLGYGFGFGKPKKIKEE